MSKKIIVAIILSLGLLTGCTDTNQAERVSHNVSQNADNFNVYRRLVVINLRTDTPVFEVIGKFSLKQVSNRLIITVEGEDGNYYKHFVGLSNEIFYNVEDLGGSNVNKYKYEVNFLPQMTQPFDIVSRD
jgi:hypothetical protein